MMPMIFSCSTNFINNLIDPGMHGWVWILLCMMVQGVCLVGQLYWSYKTPLVALSR
jgi:hypothetical protein